VTRTPAHAAYDVVVGLDPRSGLSPPDFAFALVKHTYALKGSELALTSPELLRDDFWSDQALTPRFPPGSDFWLEKQGTDVVVRGVAFAPGGRPTSSMEVSIQVGPVEKRIAVFGKRMVEWVKGRPRIGAPEPFSMVPLLYANAYGGLDPRVAIAEAQRDAYMQAVIDGVQFDHPGLYPRNPIGKGYLVLPDPVEGIELPLLEDPSDLLTADRLVTGQPELWYRQPLPWCFDWTVGLMFPRLAFLGLDAWHPAPDDERLPEVKRGYVPLNLRRRLKEDVSLTQRYQQEASLGLTLFSSLAGQAVILRGMHPEKPALQFTVPAEPLIEIEVEGNRAPVRPVLTSMLIHPADEKVSLVYCARTDGLQRTYIPGVHANIPVACFINGDGPFRYQSPPTVRERLQASASAQSPAREDRGATASRR
jgi:Uncharacterized protein conserved in bacteria (DUF2169)